MNHNEYCYCTGANHILHVILFLMYMVVVCPNEFEMEGVDEHPYG